MIQSAVAMSSRKTFSSSDAMQVDTVETDGHLDNKENEDVESMQASLPPKTEEKERGKRMMGVLMGTLNRFKTEEAGNSEAVSLKVSFKGFF